MGVEYSEDSIKTLDWKEHIRMRPGMYIGKLGDGSSHDDGIYILIKEIIDNSIDEFMMGNGKRIDIQISEKIVTIRDYGRGIPLNKVIAVSSKMNTGAKYDSKAFKKSVGLNGVGSKAVNALSDHFRIESYRDGMKKIAEFERGGIIVDDDIVASSQRNGTKVIFRPDEEIFGQYHYLSEYVESMLRNYTYLNSGLKINYNGQQFFSKNGLLDLLNENRSSDPLYPVIHIKNDDIEVAITHGSQYGEEYYSFVNGQHTTQGGTHLKAFKEFYVKTIRDHYNKKIEASDIRTSIMAAISIKVEEPIFESQTKTKLGSKNIAPNGVSVNNYIDKFLSEYLDNYLHRHKETGEILMTKIKESEKERKAISNIKKVAKDRAKKVSLFNKKLRDCKQHYNSNDEFRQETTIFITEGDSASGSITKARNVRTQGVFSLKGKPLNTFGLTKKVVYENEEFNLLQAALNIEEGLDNLRYNNVVIATDADVDGMHIRLLLLTFFLKFFPELVKAGHVYILETPLFRVRDKQKSFYCYSDEEKDKRVKQLKGKPEITRFKGLGEISPDEFKGFIGKSIKLDPVLMSRDESINNILEYFMGKNTPERQRFIIDSLRVEEDEIERSSYYFESRETDSNEI